MKTFNHRIATVDIDALSGTLYLHDVSDYIGIQVLSPTALPLFYKRTLRERTSPFLLKNE